MSQKFHSLRVSSANCQGLQSKEKRRDVILYLKSKNYNIVCLQDTHWTKKDKESVKDIWGGECFLHGMKSNSRGIAILLGTNFEYKVINHTEDREGNYLQILLQLQTFTLNLITLYGPNKDNPNFFVKIHEILEKNTADYTVLCGDFNFVMNPELDTQNYLHINNPRARCALQNIIESENLVDIYRQTHPSTRRYTWRKRTPLKQARLDYFFSIRTYGRHNYCM